MKYVCVHDVSISKINNKSIRVSDSLCLTATQVKRPEDRARARDRDKYKDKDKDTKTNKQAWGLY